jgi:hypothetical protein
MTEEPKEPAKLSQCFQTTGAGSRKELGSASGLCTHDLTAMNSVVVDRIDKCLGVLCRKISYEVATGLGGLADR